MLHAVRVEGFDLTGVARDDEFDQDFALGGQQQALQFVGVLELDEGLRVEGVVCVVEGSGRSCGVGVLRVSRW